MSADGRLTMLVGSDMHNSRPGFEWFCRLAELHKPGLLVFLGDFITRQPLSFTKEVLSALRGLAPHCFIIPGNWDPRETLVEIDAAAFDGLRNLHKAKVEAAGYTFAGLGGSTTTPVGDTPLEAPEDGFGEAFQPFLPADVWLLHNPLLGYRDRVAAGMHVGSSSLADIWRAQRQRPLLVMSGHIHEAAGCEEDGGTCFANPGSLAGRSAALVTLADRKVAFELLGGGANV